jgi:hypothetical protein
MYRNTNIAVFYHVACMGDWERVDAEIIGALTNSGLADAADTFVRNTCEDVSQFEFPTIDLLRDYAEHNDGPILYLHTKGVSRSGPTIDDWRACMLYWMVERWRECLDKMIKSKLDTVGYTRCERPLPHYQGNFWWASASHIRRLDDQRNISFIPSVSNQNERHKAEFWLLSKPGRFYEAYNHQVRPYAQPNPRSRYVGKPFK